VLVFNDEPSFPTASGAPYGLVFGFGGVTTGLAVGVVLPL
jgi:hypothetical protein